jgi:hypothetical protein
MSISFITPCCRLENLQKIHATINFDRITKWYIIYDTTKDRKYTKQFEGNPKISEYECSDYGISGNAQRNYGMKKCFENPTDFVYFLDDDNTIHPAFWEILNNLNKDILYSFDQLRNKNGNDNDFHLFHNPNGKILKGNVLRLQHIDTAQVIFPKHMIENLQWIPDDYKADGLFIQEVYFKNPQKHVYHPIVACYYNSLSKDNLI